MATEITLYVLITIAVLQHLYKRSSDKTGAEKSRWQNTNRTAVSWMIFVTFRATLSDARNALQIDSHCTAFESVHQNSEKVITNTALNL